MLQPYSLSNQEPLLCILLSLKLFQCYSQRGLYFPLITCAFLYVPKNGMMIEPFKSQCCSCRSNFSVLQISIPSAIGHLSCWTESSATAIGFNYCKNSSSAFLNSNSCSYFDVQNSELAGHWASCHHQLVLASAWVIPTGQKHNCTKWLLAAAAGVCMQGPLGPTGPFLIFRLWYR